MNDLVIPDILATAKAHGYDVFEVAGQSLFHIYSQSGGLSTHYICYCKPKTLAWPESPADLGREGRCPPGIVAVEFEINWTPEQCCKHMADRLQNAPEIGRSA